MILRLLFLVLGLLMGLIFTLNLIFYGVDLKDPLFLPTAVCTVIFLVSWLFFEKFKGAFKAIFRILAILSFLWALLVFVLVGWMLVSTFPKQGPFESKVELPDVPPEATLIYDEFLKLNRQFGTETKNMAVTFIQEAKSGPPLDMTTPEMQSLVSSLDTFLLFFQENRISMPQDYWTVEKEWPSFSNLETAIKARLQMITRKHGNGETEEACAQYEALWNVIEQLNSGCTELSGPLAVYRLSELLIVSFLKQGELVKSCGLESIVGVVDRVIAGLDENLKRGFAVSSVISRRNLELCRDDGKTFEQMFDPINDLSQLFAYEWIKKRVAHGPLYDHHKWSLEGDRLFAESLMPACSQPYHQFTPLPEHKDGFSASLEFLRNPASTYMKSVTPLQYAYLEKKERAKSLLTAFRFLLANSGQEELGAPPLDNLTGEKFLVMRDSVRTRIKSPSENFSSVDLTLRAKTVAQ